MRGTNFSGFLMKYSKLIAPLGGLILILLTWQVLLPRINAISDARRILANEKIRLSKLQAKLQDLQSLNEYELTQRSDLALKLLPQQKDVVLAMGTISKLAAENGILVESLQVSPGEISATPSAVPETVTTIEKFDKLAFKVSAFGTLDQLKEFWSSSERTFPLMQIKNLKISFEGGAASADFVIEAYFLSLPTKLGPAESLLPKLTSEEENFLKSLVGYKSYPTATFPQVSGRANPFSF